MWVSNRLLVAKLALMPISLSLMFVEQCVQWTGVPTGMASLARKGWKGLTDHVCGVGVGANSLS